MNVLVRFAFMPVMKGLEVELGDGPKDCFSNNRTFLCDSHCMDVYKLATSYLKFQ